MTNFDAKGAKRSVKMSTTKFCKRLFKRKMLYLNGRLSKIRSVHSYAMIRTRRFILIEAVAGKILKKHCFLSRDSCSFDQKRVQEHCQEHILELAWTRFYNMTWIWLGCKYMVFFTLHFVGLYSIVHPTGFWIRLQFTVQQVNKRNFFDLLLFEC